MPFVMLRAEVQAAVPAGTITVSPSAADAMALLTSAREGLATLIILACAALEAAKISAARTELRTPEFRRNINGKVKSKSQMVFCASPGGKCIAIFPRDNSNIEDLKLQKLLRTPRQKAGT